jgi:hypothetical protein
MIIGSIFRFVVFGAICAALAGCASVLEGALDKVQYEGGPGELVFYYADGNQIPSEHEFDAGVNEHYNFIELDKRQKEYVIIARFENMIQRDTLRRHYVYGWLIPNALLIYPLPIFAGIDLLTSSAYAFTPPRLHLTLSDSLGLPDPIVLTLASAENERERRKKVQVSLHTGLLTPVHGTIDMPPAYGLVGGYSLGTGFWAALGYNYSQDLEQKLGRADRIYTTTVHSVEATLQYFPLQYAYLLGCVGFDHLIFQLSTRPEDPGKRFGRNLMTAGLGLGASFGSLFVEWRRNFGLAPIETPEGPGHNVEFTHIRLGVVMRFEAR